MHSLPVPINVRCYSNSAIIVRRSEVTLRANTGGQARRFASLRMIRRKCGSKINRAASSIEVPRDLPFMLFWPGFELARYA